MIIIDRKCPHLSRSIKCFKNDFGMSHYDNFEKIANNKNYEEFKKDFFMLNVAYHYALLELAVEIGYALYTNKIKSNIADVLNKKYYYAIIDIFGTYENLRSKF